MPKKTFCCLSAARFGLEGVFGTVTFKGVFLNATMSCVAATGRDCYDDEREKSNKLQMWQFFTSPIKGANHTAQLCTVTGEDCVRHAAPPPTFCQFGFSRPPLHPIG